MGSPRCWLWEGIPALGSALSQVRCLPRALQIPWDLEHSTGVVKDPNTPIPQDAWAITEVEFRCGSTRVPLLPKHLCHHLLFEARE